MARWGPKGRKKDPETKQSDAEQTKEQCKRETGAMRGRKGLDMNSWLDPLLYVAADAAANQRSGLAASALRAFCTCLSHGADLQVTI